MNEASCAIIVAPLNGNISPEVVDITQHLQGLGTSIDQPLKLIGFVDYQALIARVLFGDTTVHDTKDEERQSPIARFGLLTPPPTPPNPLSTSQPRPGPILNETHKEGTKHANNNAVRNHGEFNVEGIGDVPQRSSSLDDRTVKISPAMLSGDEDEDEEEVKSTRSTSELRRRSRPRPRVRGSMFEIYTPGTKE